MKWLATMILLTLLSAGTGGLLGLHLFTAAQQVVEAKRKPPNERPNPLPYVGSAHLRRLPPVVTNLAAPANTWARVEASIVFDKLNEEEVTIMAARIGEDLVSYMRTVSLPQIEGARGLQYLREDLNERATVRSGGKVRELIIETLVVQ